MIPSFALVTDGNTVFFQSGRFCTDRDFIRFVPACVRFPTESEITFRIGAGTCPESGRIFSSRRGFETHSNSAVRPCTCFRADTDKVNSGGLREIIVRSRINRGWCSRTSLIIPCFYGLARINTDGNIVDVISRKNRTGRQKHAS